MSTIISYFDTLSGKELEEYVNGQEEIILYFNNKEAELEDDLKFNDAEYRAEYEMDYYCYDYEPSFYLV
jgi:hypothetical protein